MFVFRFCFRSGHHRSCLFFFAVGAVRPLFSWIYTKDLYEVFGSRRLKPVQHGQIPGFGSLQASDRFLGQIRRLNSFGASECKQVGHLSRQVQNLQGLKLEETPNMLAAVNALQFYSQESKDSLLQSIVEKIDAATDSTIKETKLQDYTNLSRFLPEKVMKYILDPNLPHL